MFVCFVRVIDRVIVAYVDGAFECRLGRRAAKDGANVVDDKRNKGKGFLGLLDESKIRSMVPGVSVSTGTDELSPRGYVLTLSTTTSSHQEQQRRRR